MVFLMGTGVPEGGIEPYKIGAAGNQNLLDNGYFIDPVNQRGKTSGSASTNEGYFVDRWKRVGYNSATVSIEDGNGLTINNSTITAGASQLLQYISPLLNRTYTLSAYVIVNSGTGTMSLANSSGSALASKTITETGVYSVTYTGNSIGRVYIGAAKSSNVTFVAVKLEIGEKQTLARAAGANNWVLNDPAPDKRIELIKCSTATADSADTFSNKTALTSGNFFEHGAARFQIDSYTGNGNSGSNTPTQVVAAFPIKALCVCRADGNEAGGFVWLHGSKYGFVKADDGGNVRLTWSDNVVSWYASDASDQLNIETATYTWIALG